MKKTTKYLKRRKLITIDYPVNILHTIDKMNRSLYHMPKEATDDICRGIEYVISFLSEREQDIIHKRYMEKKSFEEIAEQYKLTSNRISQIDRKALSKMGNIPHVGYIIYGKNEFQQRIERCNRKLLEAYIPTETINIPLANINIPINIRKQLFRAGYQSLNDIINLPKDKIEKIGSLVYSNILYSIRAAISIDLHYKKHFTN